MERNINEVENLINEDPDNIIEINYTILLDTRYPLGLALIETIADKQISCRITTVDKENTLVTYRISFRGKVIDLYFLGQEINNWLKDHKIGLPA